MRVIAGFSLAAALLLATALAAPPAFDPVLDADPFAAEALLAHPARHDPATRHYLQGVVAAARLDTVAATNALAAVYRDRQAPPALAARALALAGTTEARAEHYDVAADLLDRAISEHGSDLPPAQLSEARETRDGAMAMRGAPAQSVERALPGHLDLSANALGLTTAPVTIEGQAQVAVIDTGSDISALSATAAKRFGLTVIARDTVTRTATTSIASHMAIADTVQFGTITLHHVAFLVLDDAALSPLGPANRIDAIIGLPVLAALGRVTFRDAGGKRSLDFTPSARTTHPGNLRFAGYKPFVLVSANGQTLPFAIDSGSNTTYFGKRYAREFPERLAGLAHRMGTTIGGGGAEKRDSAVIPKLDTAVGGTHVMLSDVKIELEGSGADDLYGTIGADLLWAKGGYTTDFGKLSLTLGPD
ncbi:MAG TPA: retropepsin-like aspartic protease [Rhizomicrobium sp.]|jgi:hypothetical protein|nr:retropepsin-like aspartic protease [Rhizomicrobium sp.]